MKNKAILFAIVTVVILALGWLYFPVLTRYRNLKTEEEGIEAKIQDLDQKIEKLRVEKKLLETDPKYLEKVVRDELGLVKPGEVVYKFVEDYSIEPSGTSVEQVVPAKALDENGHLLDVTPTDQVVPTPVKTADKSLKNKAYFASSR